MDPKLRSEPEMEEVSEASSSESAGPRIRRGVKAPAPPRVNKSRGNKVARKNCLDAAANNLDNL